MTSPAKIRTDRRDALRSTGPRSRIGKAIAFRNARRHGLTLPVLDEPSLAPELTERSQRRNANDFKETDCRSVIRDFGGTKPIAPRPPFLAEQTRSAPYHRAALRADVLAPRSGLRQIDKTKPMEKV